MWSHVPKVPVFTAFGISVDNGKRSLSKQDFESYNNRRKEKLLRMQKEASQSEMPQSSNALIDMSKIEEKRFLPLFLPRQVR